MKILLILVLLIASRVVLAQNEPVRPCTTPEYNQFDFWVGHWDVSWKDSTGKRMQGMNSITKDHNGCVIHEYFSDFTNAFRGESLTVFNPGEKMWQQTWVDNTGNYMVFTGGIRDNVMELRMERPTTTGQNELFSMIWTNVTGDSLDWTWRKSTDGGKNWQPLWKIHYNKKNVVGGASAPATVNKPRTIKAPTQPIEPKTQGSAPTPLPPGSASTAPPR